MKYMMQLAIIFAIATVGEFLNLLLPFPIPASIYGLCILFFLLSSGLLKLEKIHETGRFLIEIMPVMFIPAAVGLISSYEVLAPALFPILLIIVSTTFLVMIVTGKVTEFFVNKGGKK